MSELFENVFWYITQEICIKAVGEDLHMLRYVPDHLKTQDMCEKAIEKESRQLPYVPDHLRLKKCVSRQLRKTHKC